MCFRAWMPEAGQQAARQGLEWQRPGTETDVQQAGRGDHGKPTESRCGTLFSGPGTKTENPSASQKKLLNGQAGFKLSFFENITNT